MRHHAALTLGLGFFALGLAAAASGAQALPMAAASGTLAPPSAPAVTKVEYFCGVGFVPTYGGRCVATMARDEVELFVNEPVEAAPAPRRHHRRHHSLREKY